MSQKHSHHEGYAHVASLGQLWGIFFVLIFLTFITVAAAYVDMGDWNLQVAMLIATVKALVVALFFMNLRHETGFNRLAFFGSFLFVWLFISFTLIDTTDYQPALIWQEKVLSE